MSTEGLIIGHREALSNWVRQFETIIDLKNGMYKLQESFLYFIKWGDFKPLPKLNYVLVFKSFFAKCEACSIDDDDENNSNSYYQVSLVHNLNRRIIVHESKSKAEAFDLAKSLANELHTRLKDSASNRRQSIWLM